jgi:3-oxoacyl-(acyl-carrier-protein) synthase
MRQRKVQKVVATGLSLITPLGRTVAENWNNVLKSKSAIAYLHDQHGPCRIGGRLPEYDLPETSMKSLVHSLAKGLAIDVLEDAGVDLLAQSDYDKWRTGCLIAN